MKTSDLLGGIGILMAQLFWWAYVVLITGCVLCGTVVAAFAWITGNNTYDGGRWY